MTFKEKLKQNKPLIGTVQALPSPEITEILTNTGLDWIWIDMEHSAIDIPTMQHMLQAAGGKCPCIVRPPSHEKAYIKKILDAGADGILIPLVNSPEEAKEMVNLCKYPPDGERSIGIARAHGYGMSFQEYVENANEKITVIIQIEHIEAVRNIDDIVKVRGLDAILIGPYDLSGSMGKIGQVNDPEVQAQIEIARKAALNANLHVGIFTAGPGNVKGLVEKGFSFIAVGIDSMTLGNATKEILENSRK